ncbi:hypothetical protein ASAC_0003 [Acidilobus saccharovorans 345-15]|uniref:Uncharacterized protein n=2 Tax=Acidilobus TaxID=105850 RepID=D9PZC4_ACIS3|nr:hypothetical protein ASAC_0003 [Acidilobus saccharovorans 345-15]
MGLRLLLMPWLRPDAAFAAAEELGAREGERAVLVSFDGGRQAPLAALRWLRASQLSGDAASLLAGLSEELARGYDEVLAWAGPRPESPLLAAFAAAAAVMGFRAWLLVPGAGRLELTPLRRLGVSGDQLKALRLVVAGASSVERLAARMGVSLKTASNLAWSLRSAGLLEGRGRLRPTPWGAVAAALRKD